MSWQAISEGIGEALRLILTMDRTVIEITFRSLYTASLATILSSIIGLPLSVGISMKEFPGKNTLKFIFNSLVGIPTVTLGLLLYTLFSRSGPMGSFELLYTINGIAIGQAILILPITVSFIISAIESKDEALRAAVHNPSWYWNDYKNRMERLISTVSSLRSGSSTASGTGVGGRKKRPTKSGSLVKKMQGGEHDTFDF